MNFKLWVEDYRNFGFEKKIKDEKSFDSRDIVNQFNLKQVNDFLLKRELRTLRPKSSSINEVIWGDQIGATRYWIGPGYLAIIDKLGRDLQGNPVWYTKKSFQINREGHGGHERTVAQELFERIEEIDGQTLDYAIPNWNGLRNLASAMAEKVNKVCNPIFFLEKIIENNPQRYLICFGLRGHGVEGPSQTKIEQLTIDLNYNESQGIIRSLVYTISSKNGRSRSWTLNESYVDLIFFPTQSKQEIIEPIATSLMFF